MLTNSFYKQTQKKSSTFTLFNILGTGPITYKSPDGREDFVSAIGNLNARGGGDCPELAFKGMIDAFRPEPQIGSPMFVFTDATPKDGTISNIDRLKWYVRLLIIIVIDIDATRTMASLLCSSISL